MTRTISALSFLLHFGRMTADEAVDALSLPADIDSIAIIDCYFATSPLWVWADAEFHRDPWDKFEDAVKRAVKL